jgi:hypothetical protein
VCVVVAVAVVVDDCAHGNSCFLCN